MARREFTVSDLHQLLEELSARVTARGGTPDLLVVGGAAMALSGAARRVTTDIDALYGGPARHLVLEEAEAMAAVHDLPPQWLNDTVRAFTPPIDADDRVPTDIDGVALAADRVLLAMKLVAFRVTDLTDLERLFTRLGITDPATAADVAEQVYGPDHFALPARAELLECATAILTRMR